MTRRRSEAARAAEKRYADRNREARNAYSRAYAKRFREERRDVANARANRAMKKWLARYPEKRLLHYAKNYLSRAMGVSASDLPPDLVAAKMEVMRVRWEIRQLKRDSDGNPQGEDGTASSRSDDSAGPQGHRPEPAEVQP